jgi:hypothetical protein
MGRENGPFIEISIMSALSFYPLECGFKSGVVSIEKCLSPKSNFQVRPDTRTFEPRPIRCNEIGDSMHEPIPIRKKGDQRG